LQSNYAALGVNFVWLALLLDGLGVVLLWKHFSFDPGHFPVLGVIAFLLWWFVTAKVVAGSTWARIVYLVLTILGVLGFVLGMAAISLIPALSKLDLQTAGLSGLLHVLELMLQVAGIGILFTKQGYGRRA
jgi:hypothetical protein